MRIQRKTPYGHFSLAALEPGTLFGETSFVDRVPRSGDAVTTADTELIALDPVALSTLMERDPRFKLALYWAFWKSLSSKLRQTNDNLTQFFSETGKPPSAEPGLCRRARRRVPRRPRLEAQAVPGAEALQHGDQLPHLPLQGAEVRPPTR